ncbi:MAG TPA: N-acetyltransferase [Thermoplasmata archaeon]|nr:MAG TPA: N-acetyltransferase [Thermoplasmata archaeon]
MYIRKAQREDIPKITEIYNEAIMTTTATFDTQPKTIEEQNTWFEDHGTKNPIMIAELDGQVVGWGSLSKWSDRCAYTNTAEISLYIKEEHRRKGIGKKLMKRILEEGGRQGLHVVIARITEGNSVSVSLHESMGFFHIGVMKEVGVKFGRRLDVALMEKIFE